MTTNKASFRFECNNKPSRNGKHAILLCITIDGKRKRISTGIELASPNQFNAKCKGDNWIRTSVPESKKWNQALHDLIEQSKTRLNEMSDNKPVSSAQLVGNLKDATTTSFLAFARHRTKEIRATGTISNWQRYQVFINKLEMFMASKHIDDILFTDLTPDLISQFDLFLRTLPNKRNKAKLLHPNTIHTTLKKFKAIVQVAIERDLIKTNDNPFTSFKFSLVETSKEKLTQSELQALLKLDLQEGSLLWHTRNCFFFSFYCAGIRVSDLLQLRWSNISDEGRLSYQMGKNHKFRDLLLVEQAKEILKYYARETSKINDYIFPLLDNSAPYAQAITMIEKDTMKSALKLQLHNAITSKTALLNKYLKKLATLANISKPISTHISRHSFARLAKEEGTDNSILQSLLAHSSVSTTERYMGKFDTSKTDKALQNIFNDKQATSTPATTTPEPATTTSSMTSPATSSMTSSMGSNKKLVANLLAKLLDDMSEDEVTAFLGTLKKA